MNLKNLVQAIGFGQSRANRLKSQKTSTRRLVFNPLDYELEKRQLLATFAYNSLTGRLVVETDQNSETLSIISTSNSGNYTLTTTGAWSGSSSADVGSSGTSLFVNSTASISLIQITSNAANSGSAFYFGTSSGNFVDDLTVNFTNSTSGQISVANATSFINGSILNLTTTGNQITVSSPLTSNSAGSINLTGRNIVVTGNITTAAGSISLIGNNGSYQSGTFDGVCISGSTLNVNTTSGNIVIDGRAGANTINAGVNLTSSKVQASGSGCVTITGVSGNGTGTASNIVSGVNAYGATVTTSNGSITVNGTSWGSTGTASKGVNVQAASSFPTNIGTNISATGTGNVTITGNAANGTNLAGGIYIYESNVTTSTGSITVNGTSCGTGTGSIGVSLSRSSVSSYISTTGAGNVTITGITPRNLSTDSGINMGGGFKVKSNGGLIILTANQIGYYTNANATTSGNVIIQPIGNGTLINLGANSTNTTLGISNATINSIIARTLTIGSATAGNITVSVPVTWPTNMTLLTSGAITGRSNLTVGGTLLPALPIMVTNANDSGAGSLRAAITTAGTNAGNDEIDFDSSLTGNTIALLTPLTINDGTGTVSIVGLGASNLTISGNGSTGIFSILTPSTISSLTMTRGTGTGLTSGGAIYSNSTLGLTSVTINNSTAGQGAAIYQTGGSLTLTSSNIVNSTFVTGNANYSVNGGSLGQTVAVDSGNVVSITNFNSNLTLGAINAKAMTASTNITLSCITITGPLAVTGSGAISLTGRNIVVTGNITTEAGDISLTGNNGTYQAGTFDGVCISGSSVNVNTTSGNITIDGRGASGSAYKGVNLTSSKVQAGGSGCVTVTGVSGNGTYNAYGIYAFGSTVTTSTGSVTFNGTSCGTLNNSKGFYACSSTNISATGTGNVTISGTASNGTNNAFGIQVNNSSVTTSTGSIRVNGTSCGTGDNGSGAYLISSANISATGAGNVTITGQVASGVGHACGVIFYNFPKVTTTSGSISINGTSSSTAASSWGVYLTTSANISATGAGNVTITGSTPGNTTTGIGICSFDSGSKFYSNAGLITLTANSLNLTGTVDATSAGNVLIQTLGSSVNLGGADNSANLGLTSAELNQITANLLTIGNGNTGNISVTAAISRPANGSLSLITSNTASNITVGAALSTTGTGGISLTGRNIVVTGNITTAVGDIKIYGNGGGSYQAGTFDGVCISGASVNVNTTGGNITIDGRGASNSTNCGVTIGGALKTGGTGFINITGVSGNGTGYFSQGIAISSPVTTANGNITAYGTSESAGFGATGVCFTSPGNVSSTGTGNVNITGSSLNASSDARGVMAITGNLFATTNIGQLTINGTANSTGSQATGVYITTTSSISATGSGNIIISGTALSATDSAIGVKTGLININSGTLTITGTSNGAGAGSVGINLGANITNTGAGNVNLTGRTPGNTSAGIGINHSDSSTRIYSNGGLITLTANSVNLTGTVNATSAGNVTIQPIGNGTLINLGNGTDTNTTMGLSAAEIGKITAGTLTIGSSTAGNITVSAPVTWPTNLTLITGGKYFGMAANLTVGGTLSTPSLVPILVTNSNDSGTGSLRTAISTASTNIGDDQISFDSNLTGSTISLLTPLTINDLSGGALTLSGLGASNLSLSGGGVTGIFSVYSTAIISGLTLTGGTGSNGTSPNIQGGAIYSNSTLSLTSVTINNSTANFGSAIYQTDGSLTLTSSNIANEVYITGSGNLTVSGGSLGSNVTVASGNTVSIANYTGSSDRFSFNSNSIVLSNITASGNLTVAGNSSTSCISVTGPLSATGANSISLTGRNIVVTGNITSQAGDIALYGNGGGSYQTGTFDGVRISGSTVNVNTTSGNITIDGRGSANTVNPGVNLTSSKVQAGGSGGVTITGVSGNGSTGTSFGIKSTSACVTTNYGPLSAIGTGCGSGDTSYGVYLFSNSNISTTNAGNVSVTGFINSTTSLSARGVYLDVSRINTTNGTLSVNGTSYSTGPFSGGVHLNALSSISASSAGRVDITGSTPGNTIAGVGIGYYGSDSKIESVGGIITLAANSLNLTGTVNATTAGNVIIQPIGNGTLINLGNGTDTNTTMGLSAAEIGRITAGTLTIGSSSAGNITVSAPITWPTNLTLITGGGYFGVAANLTVNGTLSTPSQLPILVTNSNNSGSGSLRDAINTASMNPGDDQISFDSNLTGSTISLLAPLTINELSGGALTLSGLGASNLSLSGGGVTGIFSVYSPAIISGLTLTGGTGSNGTSPNLQGGAIYSNSTLSLYGMTINNSTANFGSAIYQAGGSLTLTSSNISNSVYFTGSGNLTVSGGSLGSDITATNANTIVLSNITASGNLTVAGNTSTSCISVTGPLSATGTNSISLTGRNIVVTGNITSQAGDISLYGNGGGSYQTGTFDGVCISGSTVNVNTTSGNITIDGRGGLNTACAGVRLASTPKVQAGGSGGVTITGVSGNGSGGNACGIYIRACVTTSNGSLTINGTSNGTGTGSQGFSLDYSSQIAATNSGNVSIIGIAANGTNSACGVYSSGGCITTNSGLLVVNGVSCGTGTSTAGVHLLFGCYTANISSTGGGNVTVSGSTPGNTSTGVGINSSTSTDKIYSNGGLITLTANSLNLTGTVNATTAGNVLIQTLGAGVNLGNGTDTSANLGLSSVEIGNITANLLTIGNGTTGNIAVTAAISRPANGNLTLVANTTSSCISVASAISLTGSGGLSLTGRNIVVTGNITTQAGDIKLYGNGGGSYQAGTFAGVCISGSGVNMNTTGGNIVIDGRAASNSTAVGVAVYTANVNVGGSGCLTIIGLSGNGAGSVSTTSSGIMLSQSCITTANGPITSIGSSYMTGGSGSTGISAISSVISATSTGNINFTGMAVNDSLSTYGVQVSNSIVTTSNGLLSVNGTAYGTSSPIGVFLWNSGNLSTSGLGNLVVTGNTPNNSTGIGLKFNDSTPKIASNGGLITLTVNSLVLTGTVNATSAGNVLIQTLGTGVNLGGSDSSANLGLSQAELNKITANLLTIGNLTTGNIILSQNINWSSNITLSSDLPTTGTLSNSNRTLTQGSNALTATGTISIVSARINYTILISSNAPVTYGTNVLLTASITHSGGAFNTGTISFYNNGVLLSTSNITNDLANYTWSGLGAASYTNITATGNITGGIDNGSNTANVVVNQANLTITANNAAKIYNASAFTGGNGVAYSGFVGSENSTVLSGTLVYGGTSQNAINAGSYTITPSNLTSTNYNITFANGTLSVATANLTITANSISKTYGDSVTSQMGLQTSGYTVSGLQGLDSLTNVTLSSTGAANTVGAANYNITPSAANSTAISNYNITYTNGTLTVNRYNISVTANNQTKAYGVSLPTLTFTNSPLVNGDSSSVFTGALATTATANSPGGYYPITIGTLSATPNYTISSFTNGTLSEAEELTTVVTTSTDSTDPYDNVVSLREAISYGTTLTGNQAVTFSSGIYTSNLSTITLTQGVLTINDNTGLMSIQGPAASSGNLLTISGNNASGIFKVLSNATISNMTLTNGTGANGTSPNIQGGAIYSSSTLLLSNVSINNSTANYGSAIYQSGGVLNVNSSPISNSIYVDNSGDLIISGAQSAFLPQITACSLSVNISGGSITQASGSNIQVSGTASFVSTGEVILANSTNDFATLNATGTNVTINDSNSLILGTIRSNQLNVNLPSGAVTQSPGTNIVASGVASFTTSGNVTLSNATNNFGTVTASGANIIISDADNLNIGNIQSTGNLTITSVGTTNLSANITTTGDQLFNRPVILTNNVTLRTTANGNATFVSTLNGAYTLTANLGLGSLINRGTVGSCTTLNLASVGSISGSDLNLTIAPGAVIGSITGNGSNNTITVQSLSNETSNIVISGTNSGNITSSGGTSVGSFTGITRIVGGAGSDTFKFINNSALLNGTIDGGSGTNALNYGGTTKPTFINLGTGQATGVTSTTSTGVVTNIQNVFGGTGNDFLTGSAASNVMDGGAGDDTMSGLGGNDIMVGNYGADNMNGGAGIDILIGGYVDFVVGSLQEGLESIMSTWNNVTDGTFNAVSNTIGTASSTQPRLVGDTNLASTYQLQTVFNDQATDRLTDIASSTTPNWFFATERVTQGNDVVLAGTTFTVSKKTVTSKTGRTAR